MATCSSFSFVSRAAAAAFFLSIVGNAEKTPVTISHQPATWWSLPIYMAQQNGYFEDLDLEVSIKVYPSGAPQVNDAVENQAWDIGAAGSVPCIIGGTKGIVTAGISNNEGGGNALVANAAGTWPFTVDENTKFAITPNSTGHYAFDLCLESIGIAPEDNRDAFIYAQQPDVMAALQVNQTTGLADATYGSLWAPNIYTLLESNPGSQVLCTGDDVGAPVPGGIMIRKEFADNNLETVKKTLAAWMKGIRWIKDPNNREAVLTNMDNFYKTFDVELSLAARNQEIDTRPLFDLDGQLEIMDRGNSGTSTLDTWFNGVAEFMFAGGVLPEIPASNTYISDEYMKAVFEDDDLREFAGSDKEPSSDSVDSLDPSESSAQTVGTAGFSLGVISYVFVLGLLRAVL